MPFVFYAFVVDWCHGAAATGTTNMNTSRFWKQTLCRKLTVALAVFFLGGPFVFAGPAQPTNALPSKIITTDGVTYIAPKLTRVEPDGLLVEFQPADGGTGLAKLKFAKLPAALQKQFGYDPGKAADYEQQEKLAQQALTQKLQQDDVAGSASLTLQNEQIRPPNVVGAVSVDSLEPTITYTYYAPDQKPPQLGSGVADVDNHYRCLAKFGVQVTPGAAGELVHFHIDRVAVSLDMTCRYIEPVNPYDVIRQYGDGRRKIYEYFYRLGPQVAQAIGVSLIGREFTAPEAAYENEKKRALAETEMEIVTEYMLRITAATRKAEMEYSRLTDRGGNNVDRNQAAQAACDKFGKDFLNPATPIRPEPPH
jgi:hypothetical protein